MAELEIRGSGDRSYLFVHGSPSDRRVFEELADRAPSDAAVVLLDLPDHGSAPDELDAAVEPLEEAVLEAVEAAPGRVTVVGHSLGAWLIASVEERMPERADRFVAISGLSRFTEEDLALRRGLVAQIESGELDVGAPLRETMLGLFFGDERTPELDAVMTPMLDLSRERWLRIGRRALRIGERPPVRFVRPVTVVHASREAALPFARAEELAEASARAELVSIDSASHMLTLTHAAELAEHVYR
jgi:pimeloyl-ACP methyl ester carboxylesterase